MFRSIQALLALARRSAIVHSVPGYRDLAQHEHRELLGLVRAGDVTSFNRLNEQHIMGAADRLIRQIHAADRG